MELTFADGPNRRQCGSEKVVDGIKIRCAFSTSRTVTIPTGVHYYDGRLEYSDSMLKETIPICRNHEMLLAAAIAELNQTAG